MSTSASPVADSTNLQPHPKGLYLLFMTEMWERMSFYGMRALLTLYMTTAVTHGGFGWDDDRALSVYGWYLGAVYVASLLGGYLADNFLGQRRSVLIGGFIMMIGQFMLAFHGETIFFAALIVLIVGCSLLKPNISTMVGALYPAGDMRRDSAFTIFYMGINIGALFAPLISGTLGEKVGFGYGFAAAGVGMAIGLTIYVWGGDKYLGDVGKIPSKKLLGATQPTASGKRELTAIEKDRLLVLVILCLFSIVFFAGFEQAGGLMNLYTNKKIDRVLLGWEIPTSWFQAFNSLFIVGLSPILALGWMKLAKAGKDPSVPAKMGAGLIFLGIGFLFMVGAANQSALGDKAHMGWVIAAYFFHTIGELCLSAIGLSMANKLAPKYLASIMMGFWFLCTGVADKLSGQIGSYAKELGEAQLFGAIVIVSVIAGIILLIAAKPLARRMHGAL